jgi:hypothetical protein
MCVAPRLLNFNLFHKEDARSDNPQVFVESISKCVAARLLNSNRTKLSFTPICTSEAEIVACTVAFLFLLDILVPT